MQDTLSPAEFEQLIKNGTSTVLDVRRKADRDADPRSIPGASWRDPERVADWADTLPLEKTVAIYCVRGGSVSKSVQAALREKQLDVKFLEGGLTAWDATHKPTDK